MTCPLLSLADCTPAPCASPFLKAVISPAFRDLPQASEAMAQTLDEIRFCLAGLWQEIDQMPAASADEGSALLLSCLGQLIKADRVHWDLVGTLPSGKSVRMASDDWIGPLDPSRITALTGPEETVSLAIQDDLHIYFTVTRQAKAPEFTSLHLLSLQLALAGLRRWFHWLALSYGPVTAAGALPPHQRKVLLMLVTGRSEKQIAAELNLSNNTTHQYVTTIFRRFDVRNRPSLIAKWLAGV